MKNNFGWKNLVQRSIIGICLLAAACSAPLPWLRQSESSSGSQGLGTAGETPDRSALFRLLATQTAMSSPPDASPSPTPAATEVVEPPLAAISPTAPSSPAPSPAPTSGGSEEGESLSGGLDGGPFRLALPLIHLYRHPLHGASLWVDPALPTGFHDSLMLPPGVSLVGTAQEADLRLVAGEGTPVSRWVYALAAPFPTLERRASFDDLRQLWQQGGRRSLLVDPAGLAVFSALWGTPSEAVVVLPGEQLLTEAWERGSAWALVPFDALEPRWAVLPVDGQSPFHKNFDLESYPLKFTVGLQGDPELVVLAMEHIGPSSSTPLAPPSNREPNRMTVLAMTGVTALVRATAYTMEQKGIEYPARDIRDWLAGADLTHISNEVPFARNCPFPNPVQQDMRFCSDPRYIGLLEAVGTDIVELTGDHFQDWGTEAMLYTLELYRERGWLTYGGGENLQQARQAVTLEHNGNRLAFLGCNAKGGAYAQASNDSPGAAACNMEWMEAEIARLREEGYLPVATFQHFEYYTYAAQPNQRRDFTALAEAGAVIVSGSQAHQPQAIEFRPGAGGTAFIHYGLGNLFFDQYEVGLPTRQAFIDRHVFYNGRYLGVELLPILFVDYARARPMEGGEFEELLRAVFGASGW